MKKQMKLSVLFILALGTLACSVQETKSISHHQNSLSHYSTSDSIFPGFALIELFTSEGCSSCPPADDAVADFAAEFPDNVYVLGWHVDYWDYLGWKDPFGSAEFSQRQYDYTRHFELSSNYTPQVVVNGNVEFVGSNRSKLRTIIEQQIQIVSKYEVSIRLLKTTEKGVEIEVDSDKKADSEISVALVRNSVKSVVKSGENSGITLSHINIVEQLKVLKSDSKIVQFDVPKKMDLSNYHLLAFIQNSKTKVIEGVSKRVF